MTCRELTGILIVCTMLSIGTMNAQPVAHDSTVYTVTTREGMRVDGRLQGWISDTLTLITLDGVTVRIPASSIVHQGRRGAPQVPDSPQPQQSTSTPKAEVEGNLPPDRNRGGSPSLFLIPTAYPERAGDIRLGLHEIFFPTVGYGIAGYGTVQGGTAIFPETPGVFFHGTLKVSPLSGPLGALAVGVTLVSIDDALSTVPFLVSTINLGGERGNYLTCGAGYQSEEQDYFMVAGLDLPVSDHVRIVSEMFLIREGRKISYVTPGVRLQAGQFDIDLGVILPLKDGWMEFLPWIGASVVL